MWTVKWDQTLGCSQPIDYVASRIFRPPTSFCINELTLADPLDEFHHANTLKKALSALPGCYTVLPGLSCIKSKRRSQSFSGIYKLILKEGTKWDGGLALTILLLVGVRRTRSVRRGPAINRHIRKDNANRACSCQKACHPEFMFHQVAFTRFQTSLNYVLKTKLQHLCWRSKKHHWLSSRYQWLCWNRK